MTDGFRALVLEEQEKGVSASIEHLTESQLPEGDVTVVVSHSTLNYKDGMVLKGVGRLVRKYPHVPGIDLVGTVESSGSEIYKIGDKVILTGWGVGEAHWGGFTGGAAPLDEPPLDSGKMDPEQQQKVFDILVDTGSDPKKLLASGEFPDVVTEEASTIKYNADDALKGDQTKLPDSLQKGIIDAEEDDEEKVEEALRALIRNSIVEAGLWDNVHKKKKSGRPAAKKGEKGYPDEKSWKAAQEADDTDEEPLEEAENPCWDGYSPGAKSGKKTKKGKGGDRVANCELQEDDEETLEEAVSYHVASGVGVEKNISKKEMKY